MSTVFLCNARWGGLTPGNVSKDMFYILIDISTIRSEKVISALKGFFVEGRTRSAVCEEFSVNPGYLSTKIKELQLLLNKIISFYPHYSNSINLNITT